VITLAQINQARRSKRDAAMRWRAARDCQDEFGQQIELQRAMLWRETETNYLAMWHAAPPTQLVVKYIGLQSGFGLVRSRALFNVVAGEPKLIGSTRTIESLEAEGYLVKEAA
jgi:hypothetical protein